MTTIRCVDVETTGIPTEADKHAIVEIGWCNLEDGTVAIPHSVLCDPGRPIPHEAMAIHHITDAEVKGQTGSLADIGAGSLPCEVCNGSGQIDFDITEQGGVSKCDNCNGAGKVSAKGSVDYFAAHYADFERQFIQTEVPFICTYKVALRIWPELPSHGLQFLRYALALNVDQAQAMPPHRAGPDAYVCAALMVRILSFEGGPTLEQMVHWSNGPALLPRINFGKHKGAKWDEVPLDYLDWVVNKSDLDRDIKANARHHLKKRSNAPEIE